MLMRATTIVEQALTTAIASILSTLGLIAMGIAGMMTTKMVFAMSKKSLAVRTHQPSTLEFGLRMTTVRAHMRYSQVVPTPTH